MSRRRPLVHGVSFLVPIGAATWVAEHAPLLAAAPGVLATMAAFVLAWPMLILMVAYSPQLAAGLIPRRWRAWWFATHDRGSIPARIRRGVLAADRHACRYCGDCTGLQLDHVFPRSLGGLATVWNLITLCSRCNRVKSNYWRYRSGYVVYRPWPGCDRLDVAAAILAAERRARWYPWRWLLAAAAL